MAAVDVPSDSPAPLPLSFPAILRNPGISNRYAHLHSNPTKHTAPASTKLKSAQNEGKRWIRRKDNAHFLGNPHIVVATKKDYILQPPYARSTFPEPLPPYLPRNAKVPTGSPPVQDPNSANAGRFSLSLKGMRRELRKSGFRVEALVRDVEREMLEWLSAGGTLLYPDSHAPPDLHTIGKPIGDTSTIFEVSRTPLQLIWSISDDSFARYVVHCCARYHEVVSFSKETSGQRLTYLLRPNVVRPDFHAPANLDTPPATDIDYSSQIDTESDFVSDRDAKSEAGESDADAQISHLTAISEGSIPSSPQFAVSRLSHDDEWSVIGDTDAEGDESGNEAGLAASVDSLSLELEGDPDQPLQTEPRLRQPPIRSHVWDRQGRSSSSPSRSPARRPSRRVRRGIEISRVKPSISRSFHDYLFS